MAIKEIRSHTDGVSELPVFCTSSAKYSPLHNKEDNQQLNDYDS